MRFLPTAIDGVWVVRGEPVVDVRGSFVRTFCAEAFADHGLETAWPQCSVSHSLLRGTLRGLHYQLPPKAEAKLIRCERGKLFDVAVDLRRRSPTFKKWMGIELSDESPEALYLPIGCAHGFQTLLDNTNVSYCVSALYDPSLAGGIRWNDPDLAIDWPIPESPILSDRDTCLPSFREVFEAAGDVRF